MGLFTDLVGPTISATYIPTDNFWYQSDPRGGSGNQSGVTASPDASMRLSTVYACVRLLADMVGYLPLHVYRRREDDGKDRAIEHPVYPLLRRRPNQWQTAIRWRQMGMRLVLLRGNFYNLIVSSTRRMRELIPLDPDRMTVKLLPSGRRGYSYRGSPTEPASSFTQDEIFHVMGFSLDGVTGVSVIEYARETMGRALAEDAYAGRFWSQGGAIKGALVVEGKLTTEQRKSNEEAWQQAQGGWMNAHKTALLEGGIKWQQIGINAKDAQYIEGRQFSVADIARWFGIPPHMIGDVDRSTSWGCVVPETRVLLANGLEVRADAICSGDSLMAYDTETTTYRSTRVRATGRTMKPLVRITTGRGRILDVTVDHPFWAIERGYPTRHKELVRSAGAWVKAGDLVVGRHAVKVALAHGAGSAEAGSLGLAWLAGVVVGDGHVQTQHAMISITVGCPEIAARIRSVVSDDFGTSVYSRPNGPGAEELIIRKGGRHTGPVHDFCDSLGLRGCMAASKRVPAFILTASDKAVAAFLAGYLDTDGTVTASAVVWSSVSRELLVDVQSLLARLGIQASLRLHQKAHARLVMGKLCQARELYTLKIASKVGTARLASLVNPVEPRKAQRLGQFADVAGWRRAVGFFDYDTIRATCAMPIRETCAIEMDAPHTHVTAGLVTHNTGIEQQSLGFLSTVLLPWLTLWEQEIDRQLLDDDDELFSEFLTAAMLKADLAARATAYGSFIQSGIMTRNEVRLLENLNPIAGLDDPLTPLNMSPTREMPSSREQVETLGGLIRAGFKPADALRAVGIAPIQHLGMPPVTVQPENKVANPFAPQQAIDQTDNGDGPPNDAEPDEDDANARAHAVMVLAATRVVRKEIAAIQKWAPRYASNPAGWQEWVTEFYGKHVTVLEEALGLDQTRARQYGFAHTAALLEQGVAVLEAWERHAPAALTVMALGEESWDTASPAS